jgi:hypothetical protein
MRHLKICQNLPIFSLDSLYKIQFPEKILHKKWLINSQYSRLKPKKIIATGKCVLNCLAHLELKWASDLGVCRIAMVIHYINADQQMISIKWMSILIIYPLTVICGFGLNFGNTSAELHQTLLYKVLLVRGEKGIECISPPWT